MSPRAEPGGCAANTVRNEKWMTSWSSTTSRRRLFRHFMDRVPSWLRVFLKRVHETDADPVRLAFERAVGEIVADDDAVGHVPPRAERILIGQVQHPRIPAVAVA